MTGWRAIHAPDAGRRAGRAAGLAQGPGARLWRGRGLRQHSAEPGAEMAGSRAQLSTTAIYADAVGAEEQSIAARMW
jgi:integrase/recombinase XerD